jgi:signal transduction histidine kinase
LPSIRDERSRIARDLHDGVAQDLVAIGFQIDAAIGRRSTSEQSRSELRAIREEISRINATVRNEIFSLRKSQDEARDLELLKTITAIVDDVQIMGELPPGELGDDLFKILKELALNARDHAGADRLTIRFESSSVIFVESPSDGKAKSVPLNLELRSSADELRGYGITGIEERLLRHGATLLRNENTGATTIFFRE